MADRSAHENLWELIKDIRFGMFTHRHTDGRLHSHPLTTQNKSLGADRNLYFFVSRSGEVARRVASDALVNIAYADPGDDSYVSITGDARAVDAPHIVEELWNKAAEAWFPGGPTDPDLQLIQVRIVEAEYWDVKDSKITQLFKMAKSLFTDEPPKDMAEHKVL